MLAALPLVLAQLGDPRIRRVLLRSLALAGLLFVALWWGIDRASGSLDPCMLVGRSCPLGQMEAGIAATLVTLAAFWFLFPPVAIGITNLFGDEIVDAVEARHYPDATAAHPLGWARTFRLSLTSVGRLLLWNLIALPLYILLLFTGVGPFLLFLVINALALGRDLAEMVAARRLDTPELKAWLAQTRASRALLGLITAGAFMIPVANLLAPVIGAGLATHLFHRSRRP